MQVEVLLFARFKDLLDSDRLALTLDEGSTVGSMRRVLAERYPHVAGLLERSSVAVDDEIVDDARALRDGASIALLPPVSGGEADNAKTANFRSSGSAQHFPRSL